MASYSPESASVPRRMPSSSPPSPAETSNPLSSRQDQSPCRRQRSATIAWQPRDDGGLDVVNKGYNPDRGMWQKTDGVAYFTGEPSRAALKISFFGPFYGSYNVIALDKEYRYALVCGPDRDYLWLLARAPTIAPEVRQQMLDIATRQGFDVGKLVWVNQRYD